MLCCVVCCRAGKCDREAYDGAQLNTLDELALQYITSGREFLHTSYFLAPSGVRPSTECLEEFETDKSDERVGDGGQPRSQELGTRCLITIRLQAFVAWH